MVCVCTDHVEGSCMGLTFQLPQQTVIIRTASQGIFSKCSSLQISLVVRVKSSPFRGYLQLDHPVTSENNKCYSHIQMITKIKNDNFSITCFLSLCSRNSKWHWRERKKVLETFYVKWKFVMNVNNDGKKTSVKL